METDPALVETPLLFAQMARLDKNSPKEPGPDVLWTMVAMPGNLSAAGATPEEAEENFHALLRGLAHRIESEGISPLDWWRAEYHSMTDKDKASWKLDAFFAGPPPTHRRIGNIGYIKSPRIRRLKRTMARAA